MASLADIERIEDEEVLESMIKQTEDLNIRRQIRNRQKDIREKRRAAYEASKGAKGEDAMAMRLRMAEEEKKRKMKEFEDKAKEQKGMGSGEEALRLKQQRAEEEKQRKLQQFKEMGKVMSTTYNTGYSDIVKEKEEAETMMAGFGDKKPTVARSSTFGGSQAAAPAAGAAAGGNKLMRNPSNIKEMLLEWCKRQVEGYEHVSITNFSSSWADGMAFCALIHHFCPKAFDYAKLNPKNRRGNFKLAFMVAEKEADIAPLLDVEDMVRMKNPDWKCVFTYVQGFYRRFGTPQKPAGAPTSPST